MKVYKTIKGEKIPYKLKFIPNTMTVEVRYWNDDEPIIGVISEDFKKITLSDNLLSPYITDLGRLNIEYLPLNKHASLMAKDYN